MPTKTERMPSKAQAEVLNWMRDRGWSGAIFYGPHRPQSAAIASSRRAGFIEAVGTVGGTTIWDATTLGREALARYQEQIK